MSTIDSDEDEFMSVGDENEVIQDNVENKIQEITQTNDPEKINENLDFVLSNIDTSDYNQALRQITDVMKTIKDKNFSRKQTASLMRKIKVFIKENSDRKRKQISQQPTQEPTQEPENKRIKLDEELLKQAKLKLKPIPPKEVKQKTFVDEAESQLVNYLSNANLNKILLENSESILRIPMMSNMLMNGVTKSGKSTFITDIFSRKYWSFSDPIEHVVLFSKSLDQPLWKELEKTIKGYGLEFKGYDNLSELNNERENAKSHTVMIIDDFMSDAVKNKDLMSIFTNIFTVETHHKNVICIFTLQNLFADGFRTIRLNSDFICLFSSPVDVNSIKNFLRQIDDNNYELYFDAYKHCISQDSSFTIRIKKNLRHIFYCGFDSEVRLLTQKEIDEFGNKGFDIKEPHSDDIENERVKD